MSKTIKEGQYGFRLKRGFWCLFRYVDVRANGSYGESYISNERYPIEEREKARERVYQLNGWNYKK